MVVTITRCFFGIIVGYFDSADVLWLLDFWVEETPKELQFVYNLFGPRLTILDGVGGYPDSGTAINSA